MVYTSEAKVVYRHFPVRCFLINDWNAEKISGYFMKFRKSLQKSTGLKGAMKGNQKTKTLQDKDCEEKELDKRCQKKTWNF